MYPLPVTQGQNHYQRRIPTRLIHSPDIAPWNSPSPNREMRLIDFDGWANRHRSQRQCGHSEQSSGDPGRSPAQRIPRAEHSPTDREERQRDMNPGRCKASERTTLLFSRLARSGKGLGNMIVPSEVLFIHQRPDQSQAGRNNAEQGSCKPNGTLFPFRPPPVEIDQPQSRKAHSRCIATAQAP